MWSQNAEEAFLGKDFTNWKDASAKFDKHGSSSCHKEAHLKICQLPATTKDNGDSLYEQHSQDRLDRRQCLFKSRSYACFKCSPMHAWPSHFSYASYATVS